MARLSFRCDEELVRQVDGARGDVPRELWLRKTVRREVDRAASNSRAIEQALGEGGSRGGPPDVAAPPTPAEQPEDELTDLHPGAVRLPPHRQANSSQAKRGTGPRPKGGK